MGSLVVSQVSPGRKNALTIEASGTVGTARFEQEQPGSLWLGRRDSATTIPADPAGLHQEAARHIVVPPGHPQGYLDCVDQFVADTYSAIDGAAPDGLPTFADGYRAVQLAAVALQSAARDGAWVGGGMKLGFLSACLPDQPLEQIAAFAAGVGYEALEIAAWPALDNRPFTATHMVVDPLSGQEVGRVRECLDTYGLTASSLAYYGNNLHPDAQERRDTNGHVLRCIDAAAALGCPTVGTFVGRDPGRSVADNLREAEAIFPAMTEYAGERGVKIVIENCVMEGWHPDGYPGNLAYSPELWEWMFSLDLYLNFDPSHLLWVGIDPVAAVAPYLDRVAHAQAKDIQLFPERRTHYGFFGKALRQDPWDTGWWRYRIPGLGDVSWPRLIDTLYEGGFDGTISVEHEDPVWGGSPGRVEDGLRIAYRTLRPLIVEELGNESLKETPDA